MDPFSQMDPEQLARLETALQSEQAKEILGTNLSENMLGETLNFVFVKNAIILLIIL